MGRFHNFINLRRLILLLCVLSVVVTLFNAFNTVYQVNRDQIINNTIEANRAYAQKMAGMTDTFIKTAMTQLKYSAGVLSKGIDDKKLIDSEALRLKTQTDFFNSVGIVDTDGVILAISPKTLGIEGKTINKDIYFSPELRPLVSKPLVSVAGNYLLGITYPIFNSNDTFLGYIIGTIYLEQDNALTSLLDEHAYKDGSYIFVVNEKHTIISHPDFSRVGDVVYNNDAVNALVSGKSGGGIIINSIGIKMLTGYAPVSSSGWGIVVQRPQSRTLRKLDEQMDEVFIESLPIVVLTFIFIWIFAYLISKPLWQLAKSVRRFETNTSIEKELNNIKPWYFEASNLKQSLMKTMDHVTNKISKLNTDSLTDNLTGLLNRRGLDNTIEHIDKEQISLAILILDIDYFKQVNDTFGHDAGDMVLKEVASIIKTQARDNDVLIRYGGEEFLILLTNTDVSHAFEVAERIRTAIELHIFQIVEHLTISIGVSTWTDGNQPIDESIKMADKALYKAKNNGRNRTETM